MVEYMRMSKKLITIQGSARGGKGTLARALGEALAVEHRVYTIDQGLKFRIVAKAALDAGVNKDQLEALSDFVVASSTKSHVGELLLAATTMSKSERESTYYTAEISNASGMVGKLSVAHDLLVDLLYDQVRTVAPDYDIIIIDGRALKKMGNKLADDSVVDYVLAIDVHCDAFVSAQRETKIFAPQDDTELDSYSREQAIDLLVATRDIARRNTSDARRTRDPSLPLRGAYEFDVLHAMDDTEWSWVVDAVRQTRAISIDNSATRTPEQLTVPVVRLVKGLLGQRR